MPNMPKHKKLEQVISRPRYPRLFRLIDSHKKNHIIIGAFVWEMLLVEIFNTRMLPLKTFAKIKNSSTNVKTCHKQVGQVIDIRPHRRRAWTVHWYSPRFVNVHPVQYTPMGIRTVSVLPPCRVTLSTSTGGRVRTWPWPATFPPQNCSFTLHFISFKISNKGPNGHWYAAKNTYKIQYNTEKNKHKDNIIILL